MQASPASPATANAISKQTTKRRPPTSHADAGAECHNCGRTGHFARDPNCPAKGKTCAHCQKLGHFASKCRSKGQSQPKPQPPPNVSRAAHESHRHRRDKARCVDFDSPTDAPASADEEDYAFAIDHVHNSTASSSPDSAHAQIMLNDVATSALIDSGASCNLLGKAQLREFRQRGLRVDLKPYDGSLFAYGARTPLDVVGQFLATVSAGSQTRKKVPFVVTRAPGRLLGRTSAVDLGLLRLYLKGVPRHVISVAQELDDESKFRHSIEQQYAKLFTGVGKLTDYQATIHIDTSVPPIAQKPRHIPFALQEKVASRLDDLLAKDIIERVPGPTSWVSPVVIVPKPNGDVRLCVDMRQANTAVVRERYPIPTVDEVLQTLNGRTVFSKLDLRWGFHQVELEESSWDITTFAVNDGLYRFKRMLFGISSAPEKYQHIVAQVISGCPGALNIADDLVVHGKDQATHDHNLARILDRLQQRGLTLNLKKCWFRRATIEFYGLQLSACGVQPTSEKIRAITEAPRPTNASDLRSFLGTVGFSSRFIPDFSTTAELLRRLTHKGTPFVWTDTHQRAFDRLRQQLGDAAALAYYDKDAPTQVIADTSPVGPGAVLVQEQNGQCRAVCYASRTLTPVERRYSQTEKEALALVWSCERFHQFLYGMDFELVTDHKPLQTIYSPTSKPSARIERWVLRLQPFTFRVRYVPGPQNIADALSRLPANHLPADYTGETATEESVYTMTTLSAPAAVSIRDIERASADDTELQSVRQFVKTCDAAHLPRPYLPLRYELTTIGQVVLRGTRIVPPASLHSQILQLAHEGHQGIVKTKERLRTKVWWLGIDHSAERLCKACTGCQVVSRPMAPPPVKSTPLPQHPWEHLATDILGPLPSGESLLVTVDYFRRFFEVDILRGTTSAAVITRLHAHFARYGLPRTLRTDNGPQFASEEFAAFLAEMGVDHRAPPQHATLAPRQRRGRASEPFPPQDLADCPC